MPLTQSLHVQFMATLEVKPQIFSPAVDEERSNPHVAETPALLIRLPRIKGFTQGISYWIFTITHVRPQERLQMRMHVVCDFGLFIDERLHVIIHGICHAWPVINTPRTSNHHTPPAAMYGLPCARNFTPVSNSCPSRSPGVRRFRITNC